MSESRLRNLIERLGWEAFFEAGVIILVAWGLIHATQRLVPWIAERVPGRHRLRVLSLVPIIRLVTIVVAVALIVPVFIPPNTENLIAVLGATGIALGFALKDYASSLIAGIVTLVEQPYKPGDWIEIGGHYGEVTAISMRTVTIVTPDDNAVLIPHSMIWTQPVSNANAGERELQCIADFWIEPEHDANLARRVLYDVGLCSPYTQLAKPVQVIVSDKPWATHYRLKAYPIDARDQFRFTTDLTVRGKEALIASGLPIADVQVAPAGQRGREHAG